RFIKNGPNLQPLAELPAAAMKDRSPSQDLGRLPLVFRGDGEKVYGLLARHFQSNGFEGGVHLWSRTSLRSRTSFFWDFGGVVFAVVTARRSFYKATDVSLRT